VPKLKDLYAAYKDKGFVIIGVHTKNQAEKMPDFVKKQEMNWPIVVDDDGKTADNYKVEGFPTTILIDKSGKVVAIDDESKETIEKLLAEKGPDDKKADDKKTDDKKADDKKADDKKTDDKKADGK
jgi:peroxiredoxin